MRAYYIDSVYAAQAGSCKVIMRPVSVILTAILLGGILEAQHNVNTEEPIVIRSPAEADPDDGFGWAVIFHQIEPVLETDSINEVLRKTRYLCSQLLERL